MSYVIGGLAFLSIVLFLSIPPSHRSWPELSQHVFVASVELLAAVIVVNVILEERKAAIAQETTSYYLDRAFGEPLEALRKRLQTAISAALSGTAIEADETKELLKMVGSQLAIIRDKRRSYARYIKPEGDESLETLSRIGDTLTRLDVEGDTAQSRARLTEGLVQVADALWLSGAYLLGTHTTKEWEAFLYSKYELSKVIEARPVDQEKAHSS